MILLFTGLQNVVQIALGIYMKAVGEERGINSRKTPTCRCAWAGSLDHISKVPSSDLSLLSVSALITKKTQNSPYLIPKSTRRYCLDVLYEPETNTIQCFLSQKRSAQ